MGDRDKATETIKTVVDGSWTRLTGAMRSTVDAEGQKLRKEPEGKIATMKNDILLATACGAQKQEAETTEHYLQADNETHISDSAEARKQDSTTPTDRQGAKASTEGNLEMHKGALKKASLELIHAEAQADDPKDWEGSGISIGNLVTTTGLKQSSFNGKIGKVECFSDGRVGVCFKHGGVKSLKPGNLLVLPGNDPRDLKDTAWVTSEQFEELKAREALAASQRVRPAPTTSS